jgi:hypothetical protein
MDTSPDAAPFSTHTFQATVTHATDASLTWKVNGIPGGNPLLGLGTITSTGVYTAPAFLPTESIVITAASNQDPTKSASASVTLTWYVADIHLWSLTTQVTTNGQLQVDGYVSTHGPETVTWDINGVKVGSAALGALTLNPNYPNSVFYIAPPTVPAVPLVLTATSDANPSRKASAALTVVASSAEDPTITVSPGEVTLEVAQRQQFSATVTGGGWQPTWAVTPGVDPLANGLIDLTGLYKAPYEVPAPADVPIVAHLSANTERYAYAIVHVTPPAVNPAGRLKGTYAFTLGDPAHFHSNLIGILVADGNGNLSGTADVNTVAGVATNQSFTGTYKVGADGRGSASLSYTPVPGNTFTMTVQLMLTSDTFAYVYSSDPYLGSAVGALEKQAAGPFTNASVTGSYAFLLKGKGLQPSSTPGLANTLYPLADVGMFTADGAGNVTGSVDVSGQNQLMQKPLTGTYTVGANGFGTAVLTSGAAGQQSTSNLAFVVVSPSKLYLMSIDDTTKPNATAPLLAGKAEAQSGPFDGTKLAGYYVGYVTGQDWSQLVRFHSDGQGTINNGNTDERDTSTTPPTIATDIPFTGTYAADPTGRVAVAVQADNGNATAVFYMVSPQHFYLAAASDLGDAGECFAQEDVSTFDFASLTGRYAAHLAGPLNSGTGWLLPLAPMYWEGWVDYDQNVRNVTTFDFAPCDVCGTGGLNILFNNGIGIGPMRYYVVSESRIFAISKFAGMEANELVILDKVE